MNQQEVQILIGGVNSLIDLDDLWDRMEFKKVCTMITTKR